MLRQLLLVAVVSIIVMALVELYIAIYEPETVAPFTECGGPLGSGPLPRFIATADGRIYVVSGDFINLYNLQTIYYRLSSGRSLVYLRVWREAWGGSTSYVPTYLVKVNGSFSEAREDCRVYLVDRNSLMNVSIIYNPFAKRYFEGIYFEEKPGETNLIAMLEKLAVGKSDNCVFLDKAGEVVRVYLDANRVKKLLTKPQPYSRDFFLVVITKLDGEKIKLSIPQYPNIEDLSDLVKLIRKYTIGSSADTNQSIPSDLLLAIYNTIVPSGSSICSNIGYTTKIGTEEILRTLSALVVAGGILVYDYKSNSRKYKKVFTRIARLFSRLRRRGEKSV